MDHDYCKVTESNTSADNITDFTEVEYLIEEYEHVRPHLPDPMQPVPPLPIRKPTDRCTSSKYARLAREVKRLKRLLAIERTKCRILKAKLRKLREENRRLIAAKRRLEAQRLAAFKLTMRKILYFGGYAF
ncbi:uncharacterized protein LOC134203725 [Armigeres subalbatus]|uniref:uncharacterized protein LOC134202623 n=1 Tax=Armigeres subalbatus TaxID=124917 RepID=UPI002ED6AE99